MSARPTTSAVKTLLESNWRLVVESVTDLPGEHDANYAIRSVDGSHYGFKIHAAHASADESDTQVAVLRHLRTHAPTLSLQLLLPAPDGSDLLTVVLTDGTTRQARLCRWLDGEVWANTTVPSLAAVRDLGRLLGELDRALQSFDHPAMQRDYQWDSAQFSTLLPCIEWLDDPDKRDALQALQQRFASELSRLLARCPRQVIHNDANDYNVLLDGNGRLSGLLDFGDMVYSQRLFEIANAAAYALDRSVDAVEIIAELTAAYHEVNPLSTDEIDLIFDAVQLRFAVSISIAAKQIRQFPDNHYLLISQDAVWRNWQKLLAEHRELAIARIRVACNVPTVANADTVERWLRRNGGRAQPVLTQRLVAAELHRLDWRLSAKPAAQSVAEFMAQSLAAAGDRIAVGAFAEDRVVYPGEHYETGIAGERRDRHLGLDVFLPAGCAVHAPFDAVVEAVGTDSGGFGGLAVLRHHCDDGTPFWTLYGHLDPNRFLVAAQQSIRAGQALGVLGDSNVNGGWPPHLHLQVMSDLLGIDPLNWPGVTSARLWPVFGRICLSPNLLLGLPISAEARPPETALQLQRKRSLHLGRSLLLAYQEPLHIVAGEGCYLIDDHGQRWLDMVNNVAHVGHSNPRVLAAAVEQQKKLNTNTRYLHENVIEYARRLTATLPTELSVVFMVNSGSEANDLAIRMARAYTGARDIICVDHAYHGHLSSMIDVSPYKFNGKGGSGQPVQTHIAEMPDLYRGRWRYGSADAGQRYGQSVGDICQQLQRAGRAPSLFLVEAIQGCGGQLPLPDGYLNAVYPQVRAAGGLVLSDEVQVGFGRVGSHLWAFETQGVIPDIVTMGKPIGNGHPMAAVVSRPEIAARFANGMEYFNTFGGNPVSAAIGLAVLDEIEQQHLLAQADRMGKRVVTGLRQLAQRHELIGDVRGLGLFIGVEMVRDRSSQQPAVAELAALVEAMKRRHILLSTEGPLNNVLKIKPPLVFAEAECDRFLMELDECLTELARPGAGK